MPDPNSIVDGWGSNNTSTLLPLKQPMMPAQPSIDTSGFTYLEKPYFDHYTNWKRDPSPANTGAILKSVDPVINEAIRTYGGSSAGSPTLRGQARRLTLNAIRNYDPSKAKLRTHLLSQLQGLRRIAAKEDQILNIPEQVLLDMGSLRESENKLKDQLGRDPSDAELADATGLSTKRLAYVRTMRPSFAEGKMIQVDDEGSSLNQPAVEQGASIQSKGMKAWQDFVYQDLDPIDQQIMEYTLGLHGKPELSNQEVAKLLRLSPGAVSQRKAKIQQRLDLSEDTGLF